MIFLIVFLFLTFSAAITDQSEIESARINLINVCGIEVTTLTVNSRAKDPRRPRDFNRAFCGRACAEAFTEFIDLIDPNQTNQEDFNDVRESLCIAAGAPERIFNDANRIEN